MMIINVADASFVTLIATAYMMFMLKRGQTATQRMEELRKAVKMVDALIAARKAMVKVGPQGAITFTGLSAIDRADMTDACIYRMVSRTGSAAAKMAIARAEQLAGRTVDRKMVASGVHSHDGGATWSAH